LSGIRGNHCAIASPSSHARATFTNIGVLAAVIVTRTFLSWSLPSISADEAMQRLIEGNNRFLQGSARFPIVCKETLADLARGQQPYATILGCSDSRVPPELIFDADFGELFIIRVAGNVISPEVMGSMQYAGAHLHTPLFVVLGHEGCGGVKAAMDSKLDAVEHQSRIQILVDNILPGLPEFDPRATPEERLAQAVEANVRWSMHQLLETPEARRGVQEGRWKLVGAVYEIASGGVRFLSMNS
jgi:carbonic anhydrase